MNDVIRRLFVPVQSRATAFVLKSLAWERRAKRAFVIATDVLLCVLCVFVAFSLRVGALSFPIEPALIFCAVAVPLFLTTFWAARVYRTVFRFSGGRAIGQLGRAVSFYSLPIVAIFMLWGVDGVPRTVAVLQPTFFLGGLAVSRLLGRYLYVDLLAAHGFSGGVKRVLIYGAGSAGQRLALSLRHDPGLTLVGYTDDDERLDRQRLDGVEIYRPDKIGWMIEELGVDTILLAMPNITKARRAEIVRSLQKYEIHVKTLPSMAQLVETDISTADLREIRLEDLLGRETVRPNELLLRKSIVGKTVLVTGAGGSIGSELCRQIFSLRPSVLVLAEMTEHALYQIERELLGFEWGDAERPELIPELVNFTDTAVVDRLFQRFRPQTVFHAAAYKHVPLVEANALSGLRNNVIATYNAANAAREFGAERFVLVSTDKAVRPTNVMGASKRICELILQGLAQQDLETKFAIVRFGNVLGSSGSVVPLFERQIREGGPVTLTHKDVTRYFMTIPEAAQLVIQAGAMAEGGEVYLLDMGSPVRIFELAQSMIKLCGLSVRDENNPDGDIEIVEVGLRPGEKLYEELLIESDSEPTTNNRIHRARENSIEFERLEVKLAELRSNLDKGAVERSIAIMTELVPEYAEARADQAQLVG